MIDYIICNIPHNTVVTTFQPGLSDHHAHVVTWPASEAAHVHQSRVVSFRTINDDLLREFSLMISREYVGLISASKADPDELYRLFWNQFSWCFNSIFPKRLVTIRCCNNEGGQFSYSADVR